MRNGLGQIVGIAIHLHLGAFFDIEAAGKIRSLAVVSVFRGSRKQFPVLSRGHGVLAPDRLSALQFPADIDPDGAGVLVRGFREIEFSLGRGQVLFFRKLCRVGDDIGILRIYINRLLRRRPGLRPGQMDEFFVFRLKLLLGILHSGIRAALQTPIHIGPAADSHGLHLIVRRHEGIDPERVRHE